MTTYWIKLICIFFQAEDGIRAKLVTGVQTCALPIYAHASTWRDAQAGACGQCARACVALRRVRRALPRAVPACRGARAAAPTVAWRMPIRPTPRAVARCDLGVRGLRLHRCCAWRCSSPGFEWETVVTVNIVTAEDSIAELERLAELAGDVIRRTRDAGASQAEVSASVSTGLSVNVRMGEVETVERNRDRGFGLTVYFGQRKGSASTADLKPASVDATIAQACAIARYTEPDPCAGLADGALMQTEFPDLDLWHPWRLDVDRATEIGRQVEAAGRDHGAITNSEGASVQRGDALGVYANSHGFVGRERGTHHSISCSLIAGRGEAMQRDGWYEYVRDASAFPAFASIGAKAAGRAAARLGARRLSTRECGVLFAPEMARSLVGHMISAVSGGSLYRRASFLLDHA